MGMSMSMSIIDGYVGRATGREWHDFLLCFLLIILLFGLLCSNSWIPIPLLSFSPHVESMIA